ncbi:MAG TPA: hypothetical protein PKY48_02710 [Rhodoglobus sp.]|nr:hypothetical protein [Rhodoglobus sp.]HOT33612.1 hypothetical protein [Rhodoglobus sp.]HOY81453.1 hypothetical protein [Rhodoglobus sp.]HQA24083.1 hypothetical protein [Rhodoglobus sp.]HQE46059.1 hypothetical protein [Rhodoglobus sp.]
MPCSVANRAAESELLEHTATTSAFSHSVSFFSFVGNWNNYFLPYVMVPGRKAPVQVGLAELLSNVPQFNPTNAASTTIDLPTLALATVVSVAPVLLIFLFSQRFLVSGMTAGGTKE